MRETNNNTFLFIYAGREMGRTCKVCVGSRRSSHVRGVSGDNV